MRKLKIKSKFVAQDEHSYFDGITKLVERWQKRIDLE